jgi:mevalonate kinase
LSTFFGKILLFGEYSILINGKAIAMPSKHFYGELKQTNSPEANQLKSNNNIAELYHHCKENESLEAVLDLERFREALSNNLYFKSNIPQGYGMGSSGALVAALFKTFEKQNATNSLLNVKDLLSQMESFFHGKSSGIDPVTSYLNTPVYLQKNQLTPFDNLKSVFTSDIAIGLLDLGEPSHTKGFVNKFLSRFKTDLTFQEAFNSYTQHLDFIFEATVNNNTAYLLKHISKITKFQLQFFAEMLTPEGVKLAKSGLEKDLFYVKLCGSGGGGYLLVFCSEADKTLVNKQIEEYEIQWV